MRNLVPGIPVAKILIQRDESTKEKTPVLYYEKYPKNIEGKIAIICDPMLATGGSVLTGKYFCLFSVEILENRLIVKTFNPPGALMSAERPFQIYWQNIPAK